MAIPHERMLNHSAVCPPHDQSGQCVQGEMPTVQNILKLRNELLQSPDLRAPQNLAQQIQGQTGITEEAGRNLLSLFQVLRQKAPYHRMLCLHATGHLCKMCAHPAPCPVQNVINRALLCDGPEQA